MEQPEPGAAGSASVGGGATSAAALPSDVNPNMMTALLVVLAVIVVGSVVGIGRSLADSGPEGTIDPIRRRSMESAAEVTISATPTGAVPARGPAATTSAAAGRTPPEALARVDDPASTTNPSPDGQPATATTASTPTAVGSPGAAGQPDGAAQVGPVTTATLPSDPGAVPTSSGPSISPSTTAPPASRPPATLTTARPTATTAPVPATTSPTAPTPTAPAPTTTTEPPAPPTTLGPVASAQPTNLRQIAGQRKAVIAWDVTGSLSSLSGFRLDGTGPSADVGAGVRTFEFSGLAPGTTYTVGVTPLDGDGRPDADGRATISFTTLAASLAPVGPARDIVATPGPGSLTVSWAVDEVPAITGFFVSWGDTTYVGGVALHDGQRSHTIAGLRRGVTYTVDIQTFDENFNVVGSTRRTIRATAG